MNRFGWRDSNIPLNNTLIFSIVGASEEGGVPRRHCTFYGVINRPGFSGGRVLPAAAAAGGYSHVLLFALERGLVADRGVESVLIEPADP